MNPVELQPFEFALLRDLVHERFGLWFSDEKTSFFSQRLTPRLAALGLSDFSEYLQLLKRYGTGEAEIPKLISALTNNETYFFREESQLTFFRDQVLAELRTEKRRIGDQSIRIVCAGCSTGEEAYTLAMMVYETGSFFWGWNVEVVGIDVDHAAIRRAEQGVYHGRALRATEYERRSKFFAAEEDGRFRVKDQVRRYVRFVEGNILSPAVWEKAGPADVIFCRNVLIYFSDHKARAAVELFHRALRPGGRLFLGHAESVSMHRGEFEIVRASESNILLKKEHAFNADCLP